MAERAPPQHKTAHQDTAFSANRSNSAALDKPNASPATAFDLSRVPVWPRPLIQAKLQIGEPDDPCEREADSVAEKVIAGQQAKTPLSPAAPAFLQPKFPSSRAENDPPAPDVVHAVLHSSGQSLDSATRAFMEPRFGRDFSVVRVHTSALAAKSAQAVGARAFTAGSHIAFGAGEYQPGTQAGRSLLAHELTHVVQQSHGGAAQSLMRKQIDKKPPAKKKPAKPPPVTLPAVTIKPKDAKGLLLARIRQLQSQLDAGTKSEAELRAITVEVKACHEELIRLPVEPPVNRDFIQGPFGFKETLTYFWSDQKNPNFFSFSYTSLSDKAAAKSWEAVDKLALSLTGEFGILVALCIDIIEATSGENENDRSFDEEGNEKAPMSKGQKFVSDQGKELPEHYMHFGVGKLMEWYANETGSEAANIVHEGAHKLSHAIGVFLTAYEIYEANSEGPSFHAAATETAARVMGHAFNMARGINMQRHNGGEFIPHGMESEVRVARNPYDLVPLPQMKDRLLAYNMVGNRVYEMMLAALTPQSLSTPEAFIEFRDSKIANAWNIAGNAGATIVEDSKKFGGKMVLEKELDTTEGRKPFVEIGQVSGR